VLRWLRLAGCNWDARVCTWAAANGKLDTLKYARENGCPWDSTLIAAAVEGDHQAIIEWARANGCPEGETQTTVVGDKEELNRLD
jgi:hypothetical protein